MIISDRDFKFISYFWKEFLKKSKIRLLITAVYHPAADGQNKCTN
jgi:hypothetical protein